MNYSQLNVLRAEESFGERATTAGIVTLQGMVTIFVVLALLWAVVEILHACFSKKKKDKNETVAASPVKEIVEVPAETDTQNDGELVAVITAAIAAAMGESGNNGGFRVVSFKRATK